MGWIYAAIAGAAMSFQGVFNTRLSEKIGLLESNAFVQGTAFLLSLAAVLIFGKGNFSLIGQADKLYLSGGAIGLVITVTVMLSMSALSPTAAVSSILVAQLLAAAAIDYFGLFGSEKTPFGWEKFAGVALMIVGILLFKGVFFKSK